MALKILCLNPPAEKGFIRVGRWTRKSRASQNWLPVHLGYLTGVLRAYISLHKRSVTAQHNFLLFLLRQHDIRLGLC